MLELQVKSGAVIVKVRVQPKASRSGVVGEHAGALKVAVTAAPERGKANAAVVELLAKALDVPKSGVELIAGTTSRDKVLAVRGTSREAIEALLHKESR
jgi:uncharacterized protein (TIGR00251 family)